MQLFRTQTCNNGRQVINGNQGSNHHRAGKAVWRNETTAAGSLCCRNPGNPGTKRLAAETLPGRHLPAREFSGGTALLTP